VLAQAKASVCLSVLFGHDDDSTADDSKSGVLSTCCQTAAVVRTLCMRAGKDFYGPDGVYPFAGRECARAFAMVSTELEDCNDNLEDMSPAELDSLRDWESRFYSKYPVIGNIQSDAKIAEAERQKSSRASQAA